MTYENTATQTENQREPILPPTVENVTATTYANPDVCQKPGIISVYNSRKDVYFWIMMGVLAVFYVLLIVFLSILYFLSGIIMLITSIFVFALIFCLIPRRIEVWHDSVKVRFYPGYAMTVLYQNIAAVEMIGPCEGSGWKLATAIDGKVAIFKKDSCMDVLIAPENPGQFISQVRYMMNPRAYMHPPQVVYVV